ncbi:block of proliferation protein [Tritrichomonas foetus]|uniref:Block of proliferation protein n=1 Tax=Tritrichomonas foetus TaxID=1144522 RepID=A0A1J4KJZ4_9EUKA|nr:block of proliferation protein [Tritrichomonas foetus]|eukprot:OHT11633.1 block of proliferation protein [Tritrichomonas foetus]
MEMRPMNDNSSDSEDEAPINIVGNIPLEWYDQFSHIGYTATGEKVIPKERPNAIDEIIERSTNKEWWRKIYDKLSGEYKTISSEDLDLIHRIRTGRVALKDFQLHRPFTEKEYPDKIHPVTNSYIQKAHFQPSQSALKKVAKYIAAIRAGELEDKEEEVEEAIDIWSEDFYARPQKRRGRPAPKMDKPYTADSYNPEGGKTILDIDGYNMAVRERYDRCCDLYLRPREMRARLPDTAAELLPELPDPESLKPFPTAESIRFVGHKARVRSIDISPSGALLASGSSDGELRIWELQTGFCIKTINLAELAGREAPVVSVAFCPTKERSLLVACCGKFAFLIRLRDDFELPQPNDEMIQMTDNIIGITHARVMDMRQCVFNRSGNFLALLGQSRLVFIYHTSTWEYRTPITSTRSYIQAVQFHPSLPQFFVASQHHIFVYDLKDRVKLMQLRPNVQWISSIDIHPTGDHVIAGSYDGRGFWFDKELQVEPYKVIRNHEKPVRDVSFHRRFPLFATCSDDAKIVVFHGQVFDNLTTNPLLVPVKELHGHNMNGVLGVLAIVWHPTQPWLISSGADHTIRLWA